MPVRSRFPYHKDSYGDMTERAIEGFTHRAGFLYIYKWDVLKAFTPITRSTSVKYDYQI
jgi:hypothetical protein